MIDLILTYFSNHQYILYILLGISTTGLIILIICLNICERKEEKRKDELIKNLISCSMYDFKHKVNNHEVARKKVN